MRFMGDSHLHSFQAHLFEQCRKNPGRVALPEGDDERVAEAAAILLEEKLISEVHLWGASESLLRLAAGGRVFLHKKAEGTDALIEAGSGLASGLWDCVVAGAVFTTADVIRGALKTVGLASGCRTISGGFFLVRSFDSASEGEEILYFADAGVVVEPNELQLVDIARSSVDTWTSLLTQFGGERPRVAFLSFSTKGSARHPKIDKMLRALALFQQLSPDVVVDGEMQFDAAYIPSVSARKCKDSPLGGQANIFVFPDLSSGNISYKIAQRLGGFSAFGPILQGAAKPFSDLSRGANVQDIVISVCINRLRALL